MKRLYVRPGARGTGLGRALVAAVLAEATRLGYREIKLRHPAATQGGDRALSRLRLSAHPPYGDHPYEGTICFGQIV